MSRSDPAELLAAGLRELDSLQVGAEGFEKLQRYLHQLERWNRSYNLTSIKDPAEMVRRHLLDSLAVSPWIGRGRLLDAGTGAGLPGIPLAICRPELEVVLLDSTGKKVRFLNHVRRDLGLENIVPVQERLESYRPDAPFDTIISRAFSSLADFALASRHLDCPRLLAMKGRYPADELEDLPAWVQVDSIEKLAVPGLQEDRHLVMMSFKHEP